MNYIVKICVAGTMFDMKCFLPARLRCSHSVNSLSLKENVIDKKYTACLKTWTIPKFIAFS